MRDYILSRIFLHVTFLLLSSFIILMCISYLLYKYIFYESVRKHLNVENYYPDMFPSQFSHEPPFSHTLSYEISRGPPRQWGTSRNPGEACAHFTVVPCGLLCSGNRSASLKSTTSRQTSQRNRERRIFALLTLQEYYFLYDFHHFSTELFTTS